MNNVFQHLHMPPELAIEFMAVFSRFEYALKSTKYATGTKLKAEAAWDIFANDINDEFQNIQIEQLTQATNLLMTVPPRKQVLDGNKTCFRDQNVDHNQKPAVPG